MKITFGVEKIKGNPVEVVKVISDRPTELSGQFNVKQEFSDNTRTDMFYVVKKIRSAQNSENYYDWYEIINHVRFDDRFVPDRQEELANDSEGLFDVAELADDNSNAIFDIAEIIGELDDRISAIEGGN